MNPTFQYQLSNLQTSVLDISHLWMNNLIDVGVFVACILFMVFLYRVSLYFYGYILVRRDEQERLDKKNTIQELILMKTIQDELEREIEESLLNSAFTASVQAQ